MATQSKRICMVLGMTLLVLSACQGAPTPPPTASGPNYPLTLTSIAETSAAETASLPTEASSATPVALVTEVTAATPGSPVAPTATSTATLAIPASPTVPMVSVSTGTNCRSGPGRVYDLVGAADVGVRFTMIGKSTSTNYWIIQLPNGRACWLWGQYAMVEGNVSSLPEYPIPATPIPPVGSVAGTIKDSLGSPISDVTVMAVNAGKMATTGSDGTYSIPNLPAGQEIIEVSASGWSADSQKVNIPKGGIAPANFVLFPTFPIPTGTPTERPSGQVEGLVLLNGLPAAGATVWIDHTVIVGTTDVNGRYRLYVDPGDYAVLAQLGNTIGAVQVSIPPNQATTAPDIVLLKK